MNEMSPKSVCFLSVQQNSPLYSVSIQIARVPFIICSFSTQVCAHFLLLSNLFNICPVFMITLHLAVYDFYRTQIRTGQQFACGIFCCSNKNSLSTLITRFPQSNTLFLCFFLLFFQLCVHKIMLALRKLCLFLSSLRYTQAS